MGLTNRKDKLSIFVSSQWANVLLWVDYSNPISDEKIGKHNLMISNAFEVEQQF